MVIAWGGFFYPIFTRIMDSFSCSPVNTAFYVVFFSIPEYAEMQHDMMTSL